jgi:4-amino-4-deoxy-L-arabinose transferase-like glycosyltransferase
VGLLIVALAIGVRVAWVLLVPTRPVGDFAMYIESARHLAEQRAFDPEFIYMPGYVALVAAVHALGGGLLAVKMIGVVAGGLAAGAVYGIARLLFGGATAVVAGLMCALWPAGIAIASVTGTDMPATALILIAVWLLVRESGRHPLGGPLLYGLVLGLAAYLRAVALPLAVLAAPHFRARGAALGHVITRTLAACLVAVLVLLPWGIRNKVRYGEFFLTDSHGGHTALVGSNPNSEGNYSRSLNRCSRRGADTSCSRPTSRERSRGLQAGRAVAKAEPKYALGLLAAKADRLLSHERPLLYWPLYRQSVLPADEPRVRLVHRPSHGRRTRRRLVLVRVRRRRVVGVIAAFARRNRTATSLLPIPLALAALYVLFFAEARYHLPVAALLMPFAGAGVVWVGEAVRDLARFTIDRQRRPRLLYEGLLAVVAIAALFIGWPKMLAGGARLRAEHRWAVAACNIAGAKQVCGFKPVRAPGELSPVRGTWDGFGLRLTPPATTAAAATDIELPRATTRVDAHRLRRQLPRRRGGRRQRGRRRIAAHALARARIDRRAGSPGHTPWRKNAFRGPRRRKKHAPFREAGGTMGFGIRG